MRINPEQLLKNRKIIENRRKTDFGRELSREDKAKLKKLEKQR